MQIIVLGMHRSGTSTVTRLVNMMGAYFGAEGCSIGFSDENPKGFWERWDVININKEILQSHGCNWHMLGEEILQPSANFSQPLIDKIKSLILDMDSNRPWVMKDPRMCLTFKYWRPYLEIPVVIVVNRSPLAVAKSLATRNGFSMEYAIALWEVYTAEMLASIRGLRCVYVEYEEMLANPYLQVKSLYENLQLLGVSGIRLPSELEVSAFVDARLNRSGGSGDKDFLSNHQMELLELLKHAGNEKFDYKISEGSLKLMSDYMCERKSFIKLVEACSSYIGKGVDMGKFDDGIPSEIDSVVDGLISAMATHKTSFNDVSSSLANARSDIDKLKVLCADSEARAHAAEVRACAAEARFDAVSSDVLELKNAMSDVLQRKSFKLAARMSGLIRRSGDKSMECLKGKVRSLESGV